MEKTYTLQDAAAMTGLTTRTLRTYLQQGFLRGEKENGAWRFTEEELEACFRDPAVRPAIRARQHAIVYDFILQNRKPREELCAAQDLRADARQAKALSDFLCARLESCRDMHYTFLRTGEAVRVILCGPPETALDLLTALRRFREEA